METPAEETSVRRRIGIADPDPLLFILKCNVQSKRSLDLLNGAIIHFLVTKRNYSRTTIAQEIGEDINWVCRHNVYFLLVDGLRKETKISNLLPPCSIASIVDVPTLPTLVLIGNSINFDYEKATVLVSSSFSRLFLIYFSGLEATSRAS